MMATSWTIMASIWNPCSTTSSSISRCLSVIEAGLALGHGVGVGDYHRQGGAQVVVESGPHLLDGFQARGLASSMGSMGTFNLDVPDPRVGGAPPAVLLFDQAIEQARQLGHVQRLAHEIIAVGLHHLVPFLVRGGGAHQDDGGRSPAPPGSGSWPPPPARSSPEGRGRPGRGADARWRPGAGLSRRSRPRAPRSRLPQGYPGPVAG